MMKGDALCRPSGVIRVMIPRLRAVKTDFDVYAVCE